MKDWEDDMKEIEGQSIRIDGWYVNGIFYQGINGEQALRIVEKGKVDPKLKLRDKMPTKVVSSK